MQVIERLILVGFGLVVAFCLVFSWVAWLFGEAIAKGLFQVGTAGALIGAPAVWWGNLRYQRRRREIQLNRQERESRFKLFSGSQNTVAVDMTDERPVFNQLAIHPAGTRGPAPADTPEARIEHRPPVLPVLMNMDRLLIIGGMGAGKSELLRHLAFQRSREGECLIIDSHAAPGDWPGSCRVVGMGRQYRAIEAEIDQVMNEMDRRYHLHSAGRGGTFRPLTVVIDELTVLNQFADISDQLKALLCECRKVSIRLVFAGQSDRAGALGLKGNNDLRGGFEATVYLSREATGERLATVLTGTDKEGQRYLHPGPFPKALTDPSCLSVSSVYPSDMPSDGVFRDRQTDRQDRQTPRIGYEPGEECFAAFTQPTRRRVFESAHEKRVVDLFESGFSPSAIAAELWGAQNGRRTKAVKSVLVKHGCSV